MKSVAPTGDAGNTNSASADVEVDGERIVVKIVRPPVERELVSQHDHASLGFPSAAKMLAAARQFGVPCSRVGALRLFKRAELVAAIMADARPLTRRARKVTLADLEAQRRRGQAAALGVKLVGGVK